MSREDGALQTQTGIVISSKMDKTISVRVERLVAHPTYGKYVRQSSTLLAHDAKNESKVGDVVVVAACRPLSKRKVWRLERIVESSG